MLVGHFEITDKRRLYLLYSSYPCSQLSVCHCDLMCGNMHTKLVLVINLRFSEIVEVERPMHAC